FVEADGGLSCWLEYNADLFERSTVERWAGHFKMLVSSVVEGGLDQKVGEVEILPASERSLLLEGFNDTAADYPGDKLVHELFEEQARRDPDAVALVFGGGEMSYGELDARSNALARRLREERGVGPDVLVGMLVERSFEMVVGILGILKAGGAYVPMDPSYPAERIRYMLEDCGADAVLVNVDIDEGLLPGGCSTLDLRDERIYDADTSGLERIGSPSDLIYCIYTSGSTGRPKGVLIEHRN
ncbi:AMP-binding protein, partial [Pelagicoccus sp. SDUM812002]|uniref:AMP-binding protein n=1 Tax=Pelagicoccus sp. SDUM812002 TaxID=3041266 RepID=UPI00280C5E9D